MRKIVIPSLLLALLVLSSATLAVPPPPELLGVRGYSVTVGLTTQRVFIAMVPDPEFGWEFGGVMVTTDTPTDSASVSAASRAAADEQRAVAQLRPVRKNQAGRWVYSSYGSNGQHVASDSVVGYDAHPQNVQLQPIGQQLVDMQQIYFERHQSHSLDEVFGDVEMSLQYAQLSGGHGFDFNGTPLPSMLWPDQVFEPSPPVSPGGVVNHESNAEYVTRSTNGNVSLVRGYGPDVPGIDNTVVNGEIQPRAIPFTAEEMQVSTIYLAVVDSLNALFGVPGDAAHVNAIVWMVDLYDIMPPNILWSSACLSCGWMQVNSHVGGDLAPYNLIGHEFWHASTGHPDTYWPVSDGYTGPWDCQSYGSWLNGGRWIAAPMPDVSWYWWPGTTVNDFILDSRTIALGHREYIRFLNPLSQPNRPEWIYLVGESPSVDGLQLDGTRLLVVHSNANRDPLQWPPTLRTIHPADGEQYIWTGDPFPALGIHATSLDLWAQTDAQGQRPVGWQATDIQMVGEDSVSFTLGYGAQRPYLGDTRILNDGCMVPGGTIGITVAAVNLGTTTIGGTATVTSESSLLPSFQLQVPAGIEPLDTAYLTVTGNPQIPDDFSLVGALTPIAIQFDSNVWLDTLQVYLPQASGVAMPLCTGPQVGNSQGSLAVFAQTGNSVSARRNGLPAWSRTVSGTIIGVAIDPTGSYVGVATDSAGTGKVYQLNASTGAVQRQWSSPGHRLALPGVAIAHGLLTFFVGDRLYRFTLETGDPFPANDVIREMVGLPVEATGFACGTDSTYCVAGYDSVTGMSAVAVIGYEGRRIYPPVGEEIPQYDSEFYPPTGGDLNNGDDLRTEYVIPFSDEGNGGHIIVSYSLNSDSIGMGIYTYADQDSNAHRQPVAGAFGWTRNGSDGELVGPVLLTGSSGDDLSQSTQYVDYGGGGYYTISVPGEDSWNVASVDVDGSGSNILVVVPPRGGEATMVNRNGSPIVPGGSAAVTPEGSQFFGFPLVVDATDGTIQLWFAQHEPGGWRYVAFRIRGHADWYSENGNSQNTRCHPYRGRVADPSVQLSISYFGDNQLLLYWTMLHPEDPITGYSVFEKLNFEDEWVERMFIPVENSPEYWVVIPAEVNRKFFTVEARIPRPNANAPDGSTLWGEHEQ